MPRILRLDGIRLVWLDPDDVVRIHARNMSRLEHDNPGLLSLGTLDGAVFRPMNMAA